MHISDWSSAVCSSDLSTQQQEDFCNIYVRYPNATRAAVEVGYSHASARNQGYRLLRDEAVLARIAELRADMVRRHCLGTETLLAKLEALYTTAFEGQYYRSEEHTSELQSLMRISYAVFCLKKKKNMNTLLK